VAPRPVVVLVTTPTPEEGERIARHLVGEHLAACVNLVPGVRSLFWWEERVQDEQETLLVIKSREDRFDALAARVRSLHSYSVPEVIALPIVRGAEAYLTWIDEVVGSAASTKGGDRPDQK